MPAPLGKTPTRQMPDIQVFGRDDSAATRAALRFFRERRVVVHYVDLRKRRHRPGRAAAVHRAARRGGAARPDVARLSRRRASAYLTLDEAGIVARLLADPRLLRLPLVRHGNEVTAGPAEATWTAWLRPRERALNAVQPTTTPTTSEDRADDRPADVAVHEARSPA